MQSEAVLLSEALRVKTNSRGSRLTSRDFEGRKVGFDQLKPEG